MCRWLVAGGCRLTRSWSAAPGDRDRIVSPTDTASHLKVKIGSYLQSGARSVWVLYPEDRPVVIYFHAEVREYNAGQDLADPMLPGLSLPVDQLYAV